MSSFPCLARFVSGSGQVRYRLGDRLVDRYLEFVAGRFRPNTLRAVAFDLKAFFTVIEKAPLEVAADVFEFLAPHTHRDRAMVLAMLLAGLRRCEVLGLRFEDVQRAPSWAAVACAACSSSRARS